jgi:hypothetical protein
MFAPSTLDRENASIQRQERSADIFPLALEGAINPA